MLDFGFTETGCELYYYPHREQLPSGQGRSFVQDFSGKNRHLTGTMPYPVHSLNQAGGKASIRFGGAANPLKNNSVFTLRCGFVVARVTGASFNGYQGIVTDLENLGILVGNSGTAEFYDFKHKRYEFRSTDQIFSSKAAPAPLGEFRLLFFRFWQPVTMQGVQLGQDRNFADRKLDGDLGFFALFSRNFREPDLRFHFEQITEAFDLPPLPDVYPFREDKDSDETGGAEALFFSPRQGDEISKVINPFQERFNLKFSSRDQEEEEEMKVFHRSHYASRTPCIYRSYKTLPPIDRVGYIDSPYSLSGAGHKRAYSFAFVGKADAAMIPPPPPPAVNIVTHNGEPVSFGGDSVVFSDF